MNSLVNQGALDGTSGNGLLAAMAGSVVDPTVSGASLAGDQASTASPAATAAVPEPRTLALLGIAGIVAAAARLGRNCAKRSSNRRAPLWYKRDPAQELCLPDMLAK